MGLFNGIYKEGKGVSKNGPQKKRFVDFFEIYLRKFWQLCVANMLYIITALPLLIITLLAVWFLLCLFIDPSETDNQNILLLLDIVFSLILTLSHPGIGQTGLTYITRNFSRESHAFVTQDFWDTIKRNWKQALGISLFFFAVDLLNLVAVYAYFTSTDNGAGNLILLALSFCAFYVLSCMKYYIGMMVVTFKLKFRQILKNALIFTFAGVWQNLLLFFVFALCTALAAVLLAVGPIGYMLLTALILFIYPAFRSLLTQFVIFPIVRKLMIDPYYADKPMTEDLPLRRELGLIDEEALAAETGEEAPVFTDMGTTSGPSVEEEPEDGTRSEKWNVPTRPDDDEDSII